MMTLSRARLGPKDSLDLLTIKAEKNIMVMKKTDVLNELSRPSLFSNKQSPLAPPTVTSHNIPSLYFDHQTSMKLLLTP